MADKKSNVNPTGDLDNEILSEITALKNNQIESNRRLPHVMDELKKQNEETAKEVAAGQTQQWIALREKIASNDPSNTEEVMKANLSALEKLQEEMETTKDQGSNDAYESQKLLGEQIEAQKFAALSPAEQAEANEDSANADKKQSKFMKMISGGIGWLVESGKKFGNAAKIGGIAILSTLAIGGLLIALGEFLQSDTFKNMTKFISEVIIPKLMEFWNFIKENWEEIAIGIGSLLIAIGIVKAAVLAAKFVAIANKIVLGFIAVKTFLSATMLPAITGFMVPLLPIIGVAALVAIAICALWAAFESFQTTLEETGSVSEALKASITTFISTLLGAIPALFLKLVSWVAGIFGFDEFAKKVDKIDPIKSIADTISGLVSDIVDFFTMLFNFDFTKYLKGLIPETVKKVFGMERGVSGMSEVDKAEEIKSLEDDIKSGNKRAAKYEKDIATDLRARGPEHNKAGNARRLTKATAIRDKNEERLARIQELKGERPGTLSENRSGEFAPVREGTAAEKAEFKAMKRRDQDGNVIKMEQYEKDRVKREAAGAGGGSGGPTNIVDARQSSSVTTTGSSGQSPIIFQKFGRLNMRSSEGV